MGTALWLFAFAVSVHMLEEVIWLPAWSVNAGRWHIPVSRPAFLIATLIFLALLFVVTVSALQGGPESVSAYLVAGFTLVMILNLIFPHLGATVTQKRYSPGLATALFCTVPASFYLLSQTITGPSFVLWRFVLASAMVLFVAAVSWPLLLRFGLRVTGAPAGATGSHQSVEE